MDESAFRFRFLDTPRCNQFTGYSVGAVSGWHTCRGQQLDHVCTMIHITFRYSITLWLHCSGAENTEYTSRMIR